MTEKTERRIIIAAYHTHLLFSTIFKIALILFLAWVAFSLFEACIHNITMLSETPYELSSFNLLELLTNC
jgi:hypothetical protein